LRLTKTLHGFLDDFRWLAKDLTSRPTRIAELIPDQTPSTSGACDAAGTGMGGIHFVPTHDKIIPLLWRQLFPAWVRDRLSSFNSFQAIRVFAVRVTPIFTNKKHALNTLKMAPLLRNNVMLP
jgi:hypothetical protein